MNERFTGAGTPEQDSAAGPFRAVGDDIFSLSTADGRYTVLVWRSVLTAPWRWRVGDTHTGRNARGVDGDRDFAMEMALDRLRDFRRYESLGLDLPYPAGCVA